VHNHQPVGNFDSVFEEAYQKAYLPFVQLLSRHPRVRLTLHNSGCLWEWLEGHHREYLHLVQRFVDRSQVELLSGPFYEAILPVIPERDRQGQIRMLSEYLEKKFGKKPKGAWLPERVWEPGLAATLADSGIEYTLTDDWHFRAVGLREKDLDGYYITEDEGKALAVFPISQRMRYLVPFRSVEESLKCFSQGSSDSGTPAVILADDGEKFGVWPGTHKLCYQEGWLERFFSALEETEGLALRTFGEHLEQAPPKGRAYLPTASYAEMMEWALPAGAQQDYQEFLEGVQRGPNPDRYIPFVKGGFWRNFLSKYPEANHLHKRMLRVSRKVQAAFPVEASPLWQDAQRNLYRAQCNCAYWHGVFGGLYLPHLRSALYTCLLSAESSLDRLRAGDSWITVEEVDFDACGRKEIIIETPDQALYVSPDRGGSLQEWDLKSKGRNLCDTLARWEEGYHDTLLKASAKGSEGEARSIHERVVAKEEGLERYLVYDRRRRCSLLDRFFQEGTLEEERRAGLREAGGFRDSPYEARVKKGPNGTGVSLRHKGGLTLPQGWHGVCLEKVLKVPGEGTGFEVGYSLTNLEARPLEVHFGIEFNFGLLAGNAPDRYYEFPGIALEDPRLAGEGGVENCTGLSLVDGWAGFRVVLSWAAPATVWRYPVETVSRSEAGFERVYQASAVLPHWKLVLEPGGVWSLALLAAIEGL
jgi:alpha-amylase